jgi:hypothetical protein
MTSLKGADEQDPCFLTVEWARRGTSISGDMQSAPRGIRLNVSKIDHPAKTACANFSRLSGGDASYGMEDGDGKGQRTFFKE